MSYDIDPAPEPGSPELDADWCHTHGCKSADCPQEA